MRILIISSIYPRQLDPTSGIFIHNQLRCLEKMGHKVVVVSPFAVRMVPTNLILLGKLFYRTDIANKIDGIDVYYPRYLNMPIRIFRRHSFYWYYSSIRRRLEKIIQAFHPDILHVHMATPEGFIGLLVRKKFHLPLVVSLRGSDINVYPFRNKLLLSLTKRVLSESDKIVAVSKALAEAARKIAPGRRDIHVIYNGCDANQFIFSNRSRQLLREEIGITEQTLVFMFIGHIQKEKGVLELIDSFTLHCKRQPNSFLVFVGDGKDKEVLWKKIRNAKISHLVHFAGTVPQNQIPNWLSMADVLVLPSYREGLPNVLIEAMACQRPVIATTVGGIPEAVVNQETGILLKPKDSLSLAEAMGKVGASKRLRNQMGRNGRKVVLESFSWKRSVKKLVCVYEECAGPLDKD